MSFKHYIETISNLCSLASTEKLNNLCRVCTKKIALHIESIYLVEKQVNQIIQSLEVNNWSQIDQNLEEVDVIFSENEDEAINIEIEVLQFLDAIENWRSFKTEKLKSHACYVAENLMNVLDYKYNDGNSLENWLEVPQIEQEFREQKKLLKEA